MNKDLTPAQAVETMQFVVRLDVDIRKPGYGHSIMSVVANLLTDAINNDAPLQHVLAKHGEETPFPNFSVAVHDNPRRE